MTQIRDLTRHVGRSVVVVEDGQRRHAHVLAAGAGGVTLMVEGDQRFVAPHGYVDLEIDVDDELVAAEAVS